MKVSWLWRERPTVGKTSYCGGKLTPRTFSFFCYFIFRQDQSLERQPNCCKNFRLRRKIDSENIFYSILEKIKVWRERPTVTKLNIAVPVTKLPQRRFVFLSFIMFFNISSGKIVKIMRGNQLVWQINVY